MKFSKIFLPISFLIVFLFLIQSVAAFGLGDLLGIENRSINQVMIIAIVCFGIMMVSAHFLEREADKIGVFLGPFIGMMIVAAMTSIPELAVVMNAVIKGSVELAVGTIIGSNIANIALVLGIAAVFRPIEIKRGRF